jgi:hypothetical protein
MREEMLDPAAHLGLALALPVLAGIGLPFGLRRRMRETRPRAASIASFFAER